MYTYTSFYDMSLGCTSKKAREGGGRGLKHPNGWVWAALGDWAPGPTGAPRCAAGGSRSCRAGREGQRGTTPQNTCPSEGPGKNPRPPQPPPSATRPPRPGPATSGWRWGTPNHDPKGAPKEEARGAAASSASQDLLWGWGRGTPSRLKRRQGFSLRKPPALPALSGWKMRPHAGVPCSSPAPSPSAPPSHSPFPRAPAGPGTDEVAAAERRQRGPQAAGDAAQALALQGALSGPALSLPRAPSPAG
nr:mucin-1-like [Marmota flaviventris]